MIIADWLDVLDYEDSERLCERHQIDAEEVEAEDDDRVTFAKHVAGLSDAEVVRFLIELALIRSGYSSTPLADADPLRIADRRYAKPAKQRTAKPTKKAKAKTKQAKSKQLKARKGGAA
jgi:hypothetical protein